MTDQNVRCQATHHFGWMPLSREAAQCELEYGHDGSHIAEASWWTVCSVPQPMPIANDSPAIVDLVIADLRERDRVGRQRYGTSLQANNGRDSSWDKYEECLDLTQYFRQEIEEKRLGKHIESPVRPDGWPNRSSPERDELNRVAGLLIEEWQRVEGATLNVSHVATFVDLARVVIADRNRTPKET